MTTYEFEVAAKRAIIDTVEDEYGERFKIEDISTVWLCHIIGNKKGLFIDSGRNTRYYEVTWNAPVSELYVDIYQKAAKHTLELDRVNALLRRENE